MNNEILNMNTKTEIETENEIYCRQRRREKRVA